MAGVGTVVLAVIAAHVWAAYGRGNGGSVLDLDIPWGSVWLWAGMAGLAWICYGGLLAWSARHDQARLEAHFRRNGAP